MSYKKRPESERLGLKTLRFQFQEQRFNPHPCEQPPKKALNRSKKAWLDSRFPQAPSILGRSHACKRQRRSVPLLWRRKTSGTWSGGCQTHSTVPGSFSKVPILTAVTMLEIGDALNLRCADLTERKRPRSKSLQVRLSAGYLPKVVL